MQKFVLFDFDGVIADSFGLASGLALRRCNQMTPELYRSAFEGNIYDAVERRKAEFKEHEHGSECEHDIDWWGEYQKGLAGVALFRGMDAVITELSRSYRLAIITSARATLIRPFLKAHHLEHYFLDILDVDIHTHKTKKIEMLFGKYGVGARDCVFITDTLGDIHEAKEHHVGTIACSWGFHPRETLEKGTPFRIVDEPREIPDAVNDYFAA